MASDWADEAASNVTCCAGPMCCERRIAQALREARAEGMREIAKRLQKPVNVMLDVLKHQGLGWGNLTDAIGELKRAQRDARLNGEASTDGS